MTVDHPRNSIASRLIATPEEIQLLRNLISGNIRNRSKYQQVQASDKLHCERAQDDFTSAAVRSALRVFAGTSLSLNGWDWISRRWLSRGAIRMKRTTSRKVSSNRRIAIFLSSFLLLHRLLHRFFTRLRSRLLNGKANPLCMRYPNIFRMLTARVAPALGASLSGLTVCVVPNLGLRLTLAIYAGARALEVLCNALENDGYFKRKPWWLGSWMLFPLAQGQLLHAFLFDRDCFPKAYGDFILRHSRSYIQKRPEKVSESLKWPLTYQIVEAMGEMARLNWPPFISPVLHPGRSAHLPPTIEPIISSITSRAHPSTQHLSCALLHPTDPSCFSANLSQHIQSFPSLLSSLGLFYTATSILQYKKFLSAPGTSFYHLAATILRTSATICGAIATSWGMVCVFSAILPRRFAPRFRFFLGGFLGGCWQYLDRTAVGRANALYAARASAESFWKIGVKKKWFHAFRGGDAMVLVSALTLLNVVYSLRPHAFRDRALMTLMKMLRGELELGLAGKKAK